MKMDVQNKRILVVGLARSGLAVAMALTRRGAKVTVVDKKPPVEFRDILPQLFKEKMGMEFGSQSPETFLRHDAVVISPGVPWDLPQLQAARERGIPVYPEVEAASWFLEGTLIGVTGSNGKTTTTSMLGAMLRASGLPTFVGGNIGNALSVAVDREPPGTNLVTELSSFQLEGIQKFHPQVAVMLNLSPNHLDRHPSLEAYAEAKRQIFRNQREEDYAVLNADDPWVAGLKSTVASQPVMFSRTHELADGVFVSGGKVYYRVRHLERVLFETRDVTLRGDFNLEDVLAATTAACLLGADFSAIRKAVREFRAVEHRLEFVREIRGVDFYNNSKATSVDATVKSVEAFEHGVHLIMGGKDKGAPYTPLLPLIPDRVREILLIGAAAPIIAVQLAGSTDLVQAGDLETAVYGAFDRSRPGDTVLLAPACSSFDQFHDYEERGRVFKDLVNRLAVEVSVGGGAGPKPPRVTRPQPQFTSIPEPAPEPVAPPKPEVGPEARLAESPVTVDAPAVAAPTPPPESEPLPVKVVRDEPVPVPGVRDDSLRVQFAPEVEPPDPEIATQEHAETPGVVEIPSAPARVAEERVINPADFLDTVELTPRTTVHSFAETELTRETHEEQKSPEGLVESPVSSNETSVPEPEVEINAGPRHVELTYVYEVDSVELPATGSPVAFEDEPEVCVLAGPPETLNDEIMLFEERPAGKPREAVAPSPKSKVRKSGAAPKRPLKQPKLFNGSDK
jgi:UDP-N-acetylmuramoylalanine--D-glutamate ligase